MSPLAIALTDSATMLRRNLRHMQRYPAMSVSTVMAPLVILLLFVGILGDALGAGIDPAVTGGRDYVDYVAPGIILMTVASSCVSTSVSVCVDVTSGIVDRFRTMSISRAALLTGHVAGSMILSVVSTVLVIGAAVLLGFRASAGVVDWLLAGGLLALFAFALTWLSVLIGLVSQNPESASNTPLLIQFAPFLSSAFVPTDTMPAGVRWVAEHQPFTPIIETVRGLLLGTPVGSDGAIAVAWCVGIAVVGYVAARAVFNRPRAAA